MFNIQTLNPLTLQSVDVNLFTLGQPFMINIFYKSGTFVGFETTPGAWTFAGSAMVMSIAQNFPTPVPIALDLDIPANETYALYITSDEIMDNILGCTLDFDIPVGTLVGQDSNLQAFSGITLNYPFDPLQLPGSTIWNGVLHYCSQ